MSGVPVYGFVSVMRKGTSTTLRMRIERSVKFRYLRKKTKKLGFTQIRYVHRPLIVVGKFAGEKNEK